MIDRTLSQLGFNEKEIQVYLELLKRGKATPIALSKATGINRATIYSVSKLLIEKGIIAEDLAGPSRYLVALPPNDLTNIITREEKELNKTKRLIHKAIDELDELPLNSQYSVPQIRFIEDQSLEDFLYKQTPIWLKSAQKFDSTWWGFQDATSVEHFEDWIDWVWEQEPENQFVKLLSNEADIETVMSAKDYVQREIKFWEGDFTGTLWVVGDYICMMYTNEKPFYLIEINNPILAANLRAVFKGIWKRENGN